MSYYVKRLSVLKQIGTGFSMDGKALSGLAKIEKTGYTQSLVLSLINCAPVEGGRYYAVLSGTDKKYACISLGDSPVSKTETLPFPLEIDDGFACLVCFASSSAVTAVAFGTSGIVGCGIDEMKAALKEYVEKLSIPAEKLIEAPALEEVSGVREFFSSPAEDAHDYKDEVVASDNYYLYNDVDIDNLSIRENDNGAYDYKNEYSVGAGQKFGEKEKEQGAASNYENPADLFKDPKIFDFDSVSKGNYFDKVKPELESIFASHPKESALEKNIPSSKWAKIFYSSEKYYTVGLICDGEKPAYICYGVPGKYSKEPPEELKGYCSYLPLSLFDIRGEGYWMMYQNADSGECVHIDFI